MKSRLKTAPTVLSWQPDLVVSRLYTKVCPSGNIPWNTGLTIVPGKRSLTQSSQRRKEERFSLRLCVKLALWNCQTLFCRIAIGNPKLGKIIQQHPVYEDITAAHFFKQDEFGAIIQERDKFERCFSAAPKH